MGFCSFLTPGQTALKMKSFLSMESPAHYAGPVQKKRLKAIALKSEIVVLMQMIQEFSVPIRKNPVYPHKNKSDLPTDLPSSET